MPYNSMGCPLLSIIAVQAQDSPPQASDLFMHGSFGPLSWSAELLPYEW